MGELKFHMSHEWYIPKAKLAPTNGLAEVVNKNSPTSSEAARGGIFFSPRLLSHEWGIILPWEYATSEDSVGGLHFTIFGSKIKLFCTKFL